MTEHDGVVNLLQRASGIGYEKDNDRSDETTEWLRKTMKERIIEGRVLNGEPPDFNS